MTLNQLLGTSGQGAAKWGQRSGRRRDVEENVAPSSLSSVLRKRKEDRVLYMLLLVLLLLLFLHLPLFFLPLIILTPPPPPPCPCPWIIPYSSPSYITFLLLISYNIPLFFFFFLLLLLISYIIPLFLLLLVSYNTSLFLFLFLQLPHTSHQQQSTTTVTTYGLPVYH